MSFFDELKRRNVVRVGIAYVVIGWALAQVAEFAVDNFHAPEWTLQIFVVFLLLGLPLVLFLAWAFEITPDGVKREQDVDRSKSIASQTGRKLDRIIIGVMAVAIAFLLVDKFYFDGPTNSDEVVATAGRQSIAVLPFVNMSEDSDHFADGLSEELMNLLAQNPDLRVIGRTSAFAFKGRNEDLREIGTVLGVEHVLEGSVRRDGNQLRVTAQLIQVEDGSHLWSRTYDRQLENIFQIQDDVAGSISSELNIRLMPESKRLTDNMGAYALYLKALAISDFAGGDISEGVDLLDQAIALDPTFAKAYELKAMAYWLGGGYTIDTAIAQPIVHEAASRALQLDPSLVLAAAFEVDARPGGATLVEAFALLEKAVGTEPDNVRVLDKMWYDLFGAGYFRESLQYARRIVAVEPVSPLSLQRSGRSLSALGRRAEAREAWRKGAELGEADQLFLISTEHFVAREYELAVAAEERYLEAIGQDSSGVRAMVERVLDPDSGKAFLDAVVEEDVLGSSSSLQAAGAYFRYLQFGYIDNFWRAIEAGNANSKSDWTDWDEIAHQALSFPGSGVRKHPAYITPAKVELWESRGAPDMCSKIDGEWVCE